MTEMTLRSEIRFLMTLRNQMISLQQLMASAASIEYNLCLFSVSLILSHFALECFIGGLNNIPNVQTLGLVFSLLHNFEDKNYVYICMLLSFKSCKELMVSSETKILLH